MSQKNSISAIIITKNEDARIEECIKSIVWADEVIVVDNGSTDKTIEIAKRLKANVVVDASHDFSRLRNKGASVAQETWLLYIDADERVTTELQKEILKTTRQMAGRVHGYYISRTNFYLGHEWPAKDKMIRLMKKDALISWQGKLHEHPEIRGVIGELKEPLIHNTHRTLSEMVEKTNQWSEVEADLRLCANHAHMVWWRFLRVMGSAFWRSYICEGGWKAGIVGWIESIYQAFSVFITYAKLWELQQEKLSFRPKSRNPSDIELDNKRL
ncbi:glycosyltransferase family 2 protein [Patescibacteria group bacterium]|nr:glycosyltransferase family 2 protein [Patescibacteria group bacterium]